ncbi:MAG: SPASM domain-containing protein, partial [Thermodesulfobacteriota bacterium]
DNHREVPKVIELARGKGARAVNIFFLVCTGRGQDVTDITPEQYEEVLTYLVEAERELEGEMMVRARCAPHILRIASQKNPESALLKGETSGCIAATGYLRVSPEGFVTPCPYIPESAVSKWSNLKEKSLREIWDTEPMFLALRERKYTGRCGDCEFNDICGGCRARSLAASGDLMGEDPWCSYEPEDKKDRAPAPAVDPVWTDAAMVRLKKVPIFLRPMVKRGLERYAKNRRLKEITPEIMAELKGRTGRPAGD